MSNIKIVTIPWGGKLYRQCLTLRNDILRTSAGLPFFENAPEDERDCLHIAALDNGEVIGTMHLEPINREDVKAKQVAVNVRYQGCGIGTDMMAYAERIAQRAGYEFLILNGKKEAWGFYDVLGYEVCGEAYRNGKVIVKPYRKRLESVLEGSCLEESSVLD